MLSDDSKRAWSTVRSKVDGWVAHPACPAVVRGLYAKLLATLHAMTDPEQLAQQQQQPGIMNKCTIM